MIPLSLGCVSIRVSWPPRVGILFHPKQNFIKNFSTKSWFQY